MSIVRNELAEYKHWQPEMTKLIDGKPVRFRDVCVHEITMGDVEDPDLFVAHPIYEWQESEEGQWIMEHAVEKPYWVRNMDYNTWGHKYKIMARLREQDQLFWELKWKKT